MEVVLYIALGLAAIAAAYGLIILLDKDEDNSSDLTTEQYERMQRYNELADVYYALSREIGREPTVAELWEATPPSLRAALDDGTLLPLE